MTSKVVRRLWMGVALVLVGAALLGQSTVKVWGHDSSVSHIVGAPGFYQLCASGSSWRVFRAESDVFAALAPAEQAKFTVVSDQLELPVGSFDSYHDSIAIPLELEDHMPDGEGPLLVQFHGTSGNAINTCGTESPVATEWLGVRDFITSSAGVRLLWTTASQRQELLDRVWSPTVGDVEGDGSSVLQYASPLHPYFKASSEAWALEPTDELRELVYARRGPDLAAFEEWLESVATSPPAKLVLDAGLVVYDVTVAARDLPELARHRFVLGIGTLLPEWLFDDLEDAHSSYIVTALEDLPIPLEQGATALLFELSQHKVLRVSEDRLNQTSHDLLEGLRVESEELGLEAKLHSAKLDQIPADLLAPDPGDGKRLQIVQVLPGFDGFLFSQPEGEDALKTSAAAGAAAESGATAGASPGDGVSFGPFSPPWIDRLSTLGRILSVGRRQVVVWMDRAKLDELEELVIPDQLVSATNPSSPAHFVVAHSTLHPFFKISPELLDPEPELVRIEIHRYLGVEGTVELIDQLSASPVSLQSDINGLVAYAELTGEACRAVAQRRDVIRVSSRLTQDPWPHDVQTLSAPQNEIDELPGQRLLLATYGTFEQRDFFRMTAAGARALSWEKRVLLRREDDELEVPLGSRETLHPPTDPLPTLEPLARTDGHELRIVQLQGGGGWHSGPRPWADWPGVWRVGTVPYAAEIVWTDPTSAAAIDAMTAPFGLFGPVPGADYPFKFHSPLFPEWKVPDLPEEVSYYGASVFRNAEVESTLSFFRALSPMAVRIETPDPHRVVAEGWLTRSSALRLAERADVIRLEEGTYPAPGVAIGFELLVGPAPPGILSRADTVRVLTEAALFAPESAGIQILGHVEEEGSVREEARIDGSVLNAMSPVSRDQLEVQRDVISINGYHFDSWDEGWQIPADLLIAPGGDTLVLVQPSASSPSNWIEIVEATGARSAHYGSFGVARMFWADAIQFAALRSLKAPDSFAEPTAGQFLQFVEPHHTYFRVPWWVRDLSPEDYLPVNVHFRLLEHHSYNAETAAMIQAAFPNATHHELLSWRLHLDGPEDVAALLTISRRPDVLGYDANSFSSSIGPPPEPPPVMREPAFSTESGGAISTVSLRSDTGPRSTRGGAHEIPTLSAWSMGLLSALVLVVALLRLRRLR